MAVNLVIRELDTFKTGTLISGSAERSSKSDKGSNADSTSLDALGILDLLLSSAAQRYRVLY